MQRVRDKNTTASILFGVAAIQFIVGLVGWFVYRVNPDVDIPQLKWFLYSFQGGDFTWVDWALTFSAVIYVALGLAACCSKVAAALFGVAVYIGLLGLQVFPGESLLRGGLLTKILVAVLLLAAVVTAPKRAPVEPPPPSAA